jgi:hypothetical protein
MPPTSRAEAPDLADEVTEERLTLSEALAALRAHRWPTDFARQGEPA